MRFLISIFLIISGTVHATFSGEALQGFHLSSKLQSQIERIPQEERFFLEAFFCTLIRSEGLGYVLFGTKPVCLSGYFTQLPIGNMLRGSDNFAIKKGWTVWKKYEYLFPHPNYLIFEESHVVDIHPIQFVGNPESQEVQTILKQNTQERTYLLDIYSQGRWLEITLSKLARP